MARTKEAQQMQKLALVKRSSEAGELIDRLARAGVTTAQIAERTQVAERTVYRWRDEGRAPHPLLLDGLRRLANEHGV